MKKLLWSAIITLFACGIAEAQQFVATNSLNQKIKYEITSLSNKTVQVVKNGYGKKNYLIPETVVFQGQTFTVTAIADKAFYESEIKGIQLPNTIESIGECAFEDAQMTEFVFPTNLRIIKKRAFCNADLHAVNLPENLEEIGDNAFERNSNLSIVSIPASVSRIGKNALPKETMATYQENELNKRRKQEEEDQAKRQLEYQALLITQAVQAAQQANTIVAQVPEQKSKEVSSDVDINIPSTAVDNSNTFAIIIANENYQEEVAVDFALNDGETFKEYCIKTLGLPDENVHFRKDATLNNFKAEISWMQQVAKAYNGSAKFIVYYAGHGIPDEASGTSYLLPVDGKGSMLETGYSLAEFYKTLGEMPSAGVTIFMDACFSGSKRGEGMLAAARGVAIKAKPQAPKGNMVVFSAAQGDETAYPFKEKEHGLFTYFLLKKLQETSGNVTLEELSTYITEQVSRKSIVANGKSQTPSVSAGMGESWRTQKLK